MVGKSSSAAASQLWTPKSLLDWSVAFFAEKGIPSPRYDAECLLSHVLKCSRLELYLYFDRPLDRGELAAYRALVLRRAAREPAAYLTGGTEFWGLNLAVGPGCLVPRPDTEPLVEAVIEAVEELWDGGSNPVESSSAATEPSAGERGKASASSAAGATGTDKVHHVPRLLIAEWGAGSGAIGLAVLSQTRQVHWVAVERSSRALGYAVANGRAHAGLIAERGHRWSLVQGDGFAGLGATCQPSLIVSNPPYLATGLIETLEPEVSQFEPRLALDGGPDGLGAHRRVVTAAAHCLRPGGRLLLEIDHDQADVIAQVITTAGKTRLRLLEIRQDLGGRPRVAIAQRPAPGN